MRLKQRIIPRARRIIRFGKRLAKRKPAELRVLKDPHDAHFIRIIAGEKISFETAVKELGYPAQNIINKLKGPVGTKGTMDIQLCEKKTGEFNYYWETFEYAIGLKRAIRRDFSQKQASKLLSKINQCEKICIVSIEIPPGEQRKGIGTQMLKFAEKIAKKEKIGLIIATTTNPNMKKTAENSDWEEICNLAQLSYYGKFL